MHWKGERKEIKEEAGEKEIPSTETPLGLIKVRQFGVHSNVPVIM